MVLALTILYYILLTYYYLIIAYILLGWIMSIRQTKFYHILHIIVNPYMRVFRGLLVFGYFDFTPIIGILLYQFGLGAFQQFVLSL